MKTSSRVLFLSASVALFVSFALAAIAQEPPRPAPAPAASPEAPALAPAPVPPEPPAPPAKRTGGRQRDEVPMGDHMVPRGEERREVVSLLGSTIVEGVVSQDAVALGGDVRVGTEASVGKAVAVVGRVEVAGMVRRDAVSVLGGVNVDGTVGKLVSVFGDVRLGPKAVVERDVVIVGGRLTKEPGAVVRGKTVHVPVLGSLGSAEWLTTWLRQCAFMARPLAFGPNLGWAWGMALGFLGFYALLALLFRSGMERCVATLETRPGYTALSAVLTVLLTPVAMVLLAATVVGLVVVPFLSAGLLVAKLFGTATVLAWLGRRVTRLFRKGALVHPALAVLIGGAIVMLLYTVPVGGFLLFKLIGWLGVGVAVGTLALAMKREPAPVAPVGAAAGVVSAAPLGGAGATSVDVGGPATVSELSVGEPVPPPVMAAVAPVSVPPPLVPQAVALPRAGFWIRVAALALDGILVGVVTALLGGQGHIMLPLLALYGAVLWKHKGTTIGGIICGLKVVRLDGREIDWATAFVRALGCFLSLAAAGLGFIWVAFDDEKQSWHDKIAGTTVVRVPKGMSLV